MRVLSLRLSNDDHAQSVLHDNQHDDFDIDHDDHDWNMHRGLPVDRRWFGWLDVDDQSVRSDLRVRASVSTQPRNLRNQENTVHPRPHDDDDDFAYDHDNNYDNNHDNNYDHNNDHNNDNNHDHFNNQHNDNHSKALLLRRHDPLRWRRGHLFATA